MDYDAIDLVSLREKGVDLNIRILSSETDYLVSLREKGVDLNSPEHCCNRP